MKSKPLIGFIGQGWVGKNCADDFEKRGYKVVRYAKEKPYIKNKSRIKDCDIVFIAVPTPTLPSGFDYSVIKKVLPLVGGGKIAVVKSTVMPGVTEKLQELFPDIFVLHSPEFLTEATAAYDAMHPSRNIVGIPRETPEYREKALMVQTVLPKAPHVVTIPSRDAELIKYGANCWFYFKVVYVNMLHDLANALGGDWSIIRDGLVSDPRIGRTHLDPVHKSGRGAGGHCFIKDFATFARMYPEHVPQDALGIELLKLVEKKNIDFMLSTKKDLDLLSGVYGPQVIKRKTQKYSK